ncbi:MAG: hypothetical protein IKJ01_04445 [Lachnospiraceae bacterium]|nr:hypothetical protein [Lachnospiraceae bacterium]
MTIKDFIDTLENADRIQILKGNVQVYIGYLAGFTMAHGIKQDAEVFHQYKAADIKKIRTVPEIRHKKWKELNLMQPLEAEETPDFRFSDMEMKIYYVIYI